MSVVLSTPAVFPDADNVQGNTLSGFLKDHQDFVFFAIEDKAAARGWLATLIDEQVATQAEVRSFNDLFKKLTRRCASKSIQATWVNIAFTFQGLVALGIDNATQALFESSFRQPIRQTASTILGDSGPIDPSNWEVCFQNDSNVHGVLIVASDDRDMLLERVDGLIQDATDGGLAIVHREQGEAREDIPGHEHFGFKDGVSQPRPQVAAEDAASSDGTTAWQFVIPLAPAPPTSSPQVTSTVSDYPVANTSAPVTPAAPPAIPQFTFEGSYVVFRKLARDVASFRTFIAACPTGLANSEVFGAKLVGRFASGASLIAPSGFQYDSSSGDPSASQSAVLDVAAVNNFDYSADPNGDSVPRASHIRKTNPRNGSTIRILRRGIAYGMPFSAEADPTSEEGANAPRGLLFLSYQSSIEQTFQFIQQSWANNARFPQAGDGIDPIIGSNGQATCPLAIPQAQPSPLDIARFVSTKATCYLFSPSMDALRTLASLTS